MRQYQITDQGQLRQYESKVEIKEKSNWWIILSPKELEKYQHLFKVSKKTVSECLNEVDLPKLEVYDHYDFGLVQVIERANGKVTKSHINFYLGQSYLILVIKNELTWLTQLEEELLQDEEEYYSPEKILYLLLDKLIAKDGKSLDYIENEINYLEEAVLKGKKRDYIKEINDLRKKLLYFKRHYEPLMDIANGLEENDNDLFDAKAMRYFRILSNRINRLNMRVLNLKDNINQIREAYDAQVDIGLNKIMKVFTVITVIFAPLSFIAGWYGMNFNHIPELEWAYGYGYVIVLSVVSIISCLIYFKKKDWL